MSANDCDVLIVGAGPTGLTLACVLTRWGIRCRVIDLSATPPTGSRGKGLQPRSLEMLDDLGIVERVISHGAFGIPVCHYDEAGHPTIDPQPRLAPRTDAPYLAPLITPQWRVEEALRALLVSLGGQVDFGLPLVAIEQHEEGVTAHLEPTDGQRSIRATWLVGCDGGKSQVRHLSKRTGCWWPMCRPPVWTAITGTSGAAPRVSSGCAPYPRRRHFSCRPRSGRDRMPH